MPHADPADTQAVVVKKLQSAFKTYDSASKKFLTALKNLDDAMEAIAISFRELSHGEEVDMNTKKRCSDFCTAIDVHKTASDPKKKSSTDGSAAAPGDYCFASFLTDISAEVGSAMTRLKENMKILEKEQSSRDKASGKYQKLRAEVDKLETKLAKKNESIANNPKFAAKMTQRDDAKAEAERAAAGYESSFQDFLKLRNETVLSMVSGTSTRSKRYFEGLASVMGTGT